MAVQASPAGHASTIAGHDRDAHEVFGREKIATELFFAIVSGNVVHVGIGECDVEPPLAWGLGKRRVTTSAKRAMRVRGNALGRVLCLTRLVLSGHRRAWPLPRLATRSVALLHPPPLPLPSPR